jgi:hypothetical protein
VGERGVAEESAHPADQVIYQSRMPRVSVCGTRYGHGLCTILWIKAKDSEWVLLPHGVPNLAVHLSTDEMVIMLNRLREKM